MDARRGDFPWDYVRSITGGPRTKRAPDFLGLLEVGDGSLLCSCVGGSLTVLRTDNSRYTSAGQGIRKRYHHPLQKHGPAGLQCRLVSGVRSLRVHHPSLSAETLRCQVKQEHNYHSTQEAAACQFCMKSTTQSSATTGSCAHIQGQGGQRMGLALLPARVITRREAQGSSALSQHTTNWSVLGNVAHKTPGDGDQRMALCSAPVLARCHSDEQSKQQWCTLGVSQATVL